MANDQGSSATLEWESWRVSDDGRVVLLRYAGSSTAWAERARVVVGERSIEVTLERTRRGGKLDRRWRWAAVTLEAPLGDRDVLGASERLKRLMGDDRPRDHGREPIHPVARI